MYPVWTFVRHRLIAATVHLSRAVFAVTNGKRPKFLFSSAVKAESVGTDVKILEKRFDSVTLAKCNADGSVSDADFKIMTATDLHLGAPGAELNNKSLQKLMDRIKDEKPDLVIFTGDVILSDCQQIDAVQLSMLMEKAGVYWAYVFGNHEAREEKEYFKYLLYKGLAYCEHCLNLFGDPSLYGYGNFAIHIKNGENSLAKSLYLFDSGRDIQKKSIEKYGLPTDMRGYDFIKEEQINWYLNEAARVKAVYGEAGSFCYMHIPVPEYKNVFDGNEAEGFTPSGRCELLYGTQFESVGCSPYNSGLFERGREKGGLQAMFAGHDHINDFCALYKGVYLVYTQCGGYNTYNMMEKAGWDEKDCHFGVTLTTVGKNGNILIEQKKHSRKQSAV